MLPRWSAVQQTHIACPGGFATGGTELLHQLVHTLRGLGRECFIHYYERPELGRPAVFDCYDAPTGELRSSPGHLLVVPETGIHVLSRFPQAQRCIWWLSVDNFFAFYGAGTATPALLRWFKSRRAAGLLQRWLRDPAITHLAQRQYALDFLAQHGATGQFLGDYLRDEFLSIRADDIPPKQRWVCFNPQMGFEFTRELLQLPVDWHWKELVNLNPAQMRELLLQSAEYIYFGQHPGKDRIPREAAMAGAVVVSGRGGSAANGVDVPIPERFKIDHTAPRAAYAVLQLISSILHDPASRMPIAAPFAKNGLISCAMPGVYLPSPALYWPSCPKS